MILETGQRIYPIKHTDTQRALQDSFHEKWGKNMALGITALATGDFKPFKGFPRENFQNILAVGLRLDSASQNQVMTRVTRPMAIIAQKYRIPAIFAGDGDLLPHVTLHVGVFKNIQDYEKQEILRWIQSGGSHLAQLSNILCGLDYHLDSIVVGPNSYIGASKVNLEQGAPYRARQVIEYMMRRAVGHVESMNESTLEGTFAPPYRYDDIFHTSVSRITDIAPSEALLLFAHEAYETIGQSLLSEPIHIKVDSVNYGIAAEGIAKEIPTLLI